MDSGGEEKNEKKPEVSSSKKDVPSSMQKVCLVCGDKALGYNFNAISCESCKAFFRRNALANKAFKCPFTNKCEINVVTRRFCQKCRMVKCLAVGMVKEFIMSPEDKAEKRRKIEENRAKKRQLELEEPDSKSNKLNKKGKNNASKEDSNGAFIDNSPKTYRDDNSSPFLDNTSNPYTEEATSNLYNNTSDIYQDNTSAYKEETTTTAYKDDNTNVYKADNNSTYREIVFKNRDDSLFSYRDNTIPYMDNSISMPFKPNGSIQYSDGNTMPYPETSIQYDILSTTCSPNRSMQSPTNNNIERSIQSPPVYSTYSVQSNETHRFQTDEKVIVNSKLLDRRTDGFHISEATSSNSTYPDKKQNCIRSILTNGDTEERQAECDQTPTPASSSTDEDVNKAREILQDVERIEPNSMESILCEAIKLEFEAYTSINPCPSSRELNDVERAKLNELIVANKMLHAPIDEDISILLGDNAIPNSIRDCNQQDPRLIKIVNLTAVAIRRFIKMAKKINAFKNMCEEDQIALLKGGCIEMLVLRSAMQYDGQRNIWNVPHSQQDGTIRTDLLKLAKGNVYTKHEAFIRSFDKRWRGDENIMLIMSAILLFTPARPKVVHKDVIKLEQNSYYYLLRRYLESVFIGCEAKSTFLKLIQKILELRKLAEEVTEVYLDVNPLEPLLMEIFDLKHHVA